MVMSITGSENARREVYLFEGEECFVGINWTAFLDNENDGDGTEIDTSTWLASVPAGLTLTADAIDTGTDAAETRNVRTGVHVSGGVAGTAYKLWNRVTLDTNDIFYSYKIVIVEARD
jgi:hypothetical protein